jgi:hypothetical protein
MARGRLLVASSDSPIFALLKATVHRFAKGSSKDDVPLSNEICRCCAGQFFVPHHRTNRYKIFLRDFGSRKRDKLPRLEESWLRGLDLNQRPSGYEPDELPGCSTPRDENTWDVNSLQIEKPSTWMKRICLSSHRDFVEV